MATPQPCSKSSIPCKNYSVATKKKIKKQAKKLQVGRES